MSRRSSAEIINATLVEVFLAFLFVVLSVAWFATRDLRHAQDKNRELEQRATNAARERDAATEAKRRAEERFNSKFPPECPASRSDSRYFLVITLAGPDYVVAEVQYDVLTYKRGDVMRGTLRDFAGNFAAAVKYSDENKCKFRVRIDDTDRMSKADFKRAIATIKGPFYISGETR